MIPDALISCGYLLLGCGYCINRLADHSREKFSKLLPQFLIASAGVAAIGARSLYALVYNLFWRSYPIDPRLIAKELERVEHNKNFVDWILDRGGIAAFVYSYYYHYEYFSTASFVVLSFTTVEALLFKEDFANTQGHGSWRRVSTFIRRRPYPPFILWILSNELFGRAVGNNFCRLANVPYSVTTWAFPARGFYQGWSIVSSINDYMMLCYIILMTEGLCA